MDQDGPGAAMSARHAVIALVIIGTIIALSLLAKIESDRDAERDACRKAQSLDRATGARVEECD